MDVDTLIVDTSYLTSLNEDYGNRIVIDLEAGDLGQQGNPNLRDTITNIENVTYNGLFNTLIRGDENSNILIGGSGNDRIIGNGGDDHFKDLMETMPFFRRLWPNYNYGGSGNDTLEIGLSKVVYPNDKTTIMRTLYTA